MHKYRLVAKKGEGTFSEVLKAQCIKNGKYVAIKCMKNHFDSLDQVNNLREIQALRRLSPHANIIKLLEVLYDQPTGRLALVFELMDMNIYELIRGRRHYVAEDRIKNYMYQLMKAMDHMHRNGIFHRDIKPENILIMDDCLKLADFGSCRGIYSKQPYTEYISTRWYRAPECLLTDGYYNYKMDMWGVGCVFFEIVSLFPLFPGTNELDQITKIHNILGTPPPELLAKMKKRSQHMDFNFPPKEGTGVAKLIPHVNPECVDLIVKLLSYNPDERLSARQALRHPYFRDLREAEKRQKALMAPDVSGHLTAMEADKVRQQQQTVSSNGSEHETAHAPATPPGADPPNEGSAGLPSISVRSHQQQDPAHKEDSSEGAADTGSGATYPKLPGLAAQSSTASVEGIPEDASLPPIANLSLSKANMTGSTVAGVVAHTSTRRSTMNNFYDGNGSGGPASYKAKAGAAAAAGGGAAAAAAGVAPGGAAGAAAAAAATGAVAGSGAAGPPPANAGAVGRRQSVGVVAAKYGAVNKQTSQGHGQATGVAGVTGPAMGVTATRTEPQGGTVKYNKANVGKTNSKYISPYSLRQLAGQNAAGQA
ncbi:hypothetical protein VOLCADRAFT_58667 [Volvox carteri f. nagariensis]|uniref:Uncharacterized protein mapk1 n=1 Tax=Volvox carteri f. nagariensis TaxID=3068 RepID=D8TR37_VOLCA|nr:uncharacterized protein VOLCADRAFT_58667 [Volvox carteri f. nagariensis]EFJ50133.1 hypothetical protein VOLCADRAFT_58667 [Volvox carteri f. nagariensis]|eukprot:XP_002948753.1 hypothetical protein VOLCADRAFT_58667 [Volvox carteri f. nagariensis]